MKLIHIDVGGPVYSIRWGKIGWTFEMHRYCGPVVVHPRTHEPKDVQPAERSGFWKAVTMWDKQGRRATPLGICIYDLN